MKIDLSKYDDPKVYDNNTIIDKIRKFKRPANPEEFVRQKIIEYLHDELEIPYYAMATEEAVAHYKKYNRKKMDIVIFGEGKEKNKIIMIVECKANTVSLTENVLEQAKDYAEIPEINCPVIAITNGNNINFLKRDENNNYEQIVHPPTYDDLINMNLDTHRIEEFKYTRWDYDDLFNENVLNIEMKIRNYINKSMESYKSLFPYILNIAECFIDNSHKVNDLPLKTCEFIKDEGVHLIDLGVPTANFTQYYRSLSIKHENKLEVVTVGSSIMPTSPKNSHPSIFFSLADDNSKHNILFEYYLDKNMEIKDDVIHLTHHGKVSTGKSGSVNGDEVINYVKNNSDLTIENNKVILGKLDASKLLYIDDNDFKEFLSNLIEYALLRIKIKELKKTGKWKNAE